ncbi:hypothetical protein ACUDA6_18595 [Pseudomonas ceruminis]|uniref:hypothetical protein n=1 Tax=Pseudomonas TaxID=286 RepID=UPI00257BD6F6|nr:MULTISPECIES: hypothetical protein [unclassified Pseudomonas]
MSQKFEREERYIVFKVKDLSEHKLGWVRDVIRLNNIPTVDAVVVEADWPEYEPTWAAIERRVTGGQWNGEGLPPVGVDCEYFDGGEWMRCEVVAHRNNAAVVLSDCYEPAFVSQQELRPFRTPDQVAAEEREKAIAEMVSTSPMLDKGWARKVCTALFEAGYRKQVAP